MARVSKFPLFAVLVSVFSSSKIHSQPINTKEIKYSTDYDGFYPDYSALIAEPTTVEEMEAMVCSNWTCIRKCCPDNTFLSLTHEYGCLPANETDPKFDPEFRHEDGQPTYPNKPIRRLYMTDKKPCSSFGVLPEHREAFLLNDGRLYTPHDRVYHIVSRYCLDVVHRGNENFGMWPVTCYEKYEKTSRIVFRVYSHATCLLLSCVALVIVIVCHAALPELRDLSGLCLLSHVSSLLVADVGLVAVTLDRDISTRLCIFLGMTIHVSFLATYMWLTVMCFDIWRYVRLSLRSVPSPVLQQQEKSLFKLYSIVVWGSLIVIAAVTSTLQFLPEEAIPEYIIRPHFGVNRCFIIESDANLLLYFFLMLALLCLLSVTFVGKTVHHLYDGGAKICCFQKTTLPVDSTAFNNKYLDLFWQRFQIFAVTVFVWTTEVLSWKIPPEELWDATDLLNTLQGVFLFVIFLRSKRKRDLIETKARSFVVKAQLVVRRLLGQGRTSPSAGEPNLRKVDIYDVTGDSSRRSV